MPGTTVEGVDSPTSSSGSDTTTKSEFKQVKLHAQNQIILSQVLAEEREQVCIYMYLQLEAELERKREGGGRVKRGWRE